MEKLNKLIHEEFESQTKPAEFKDQEWDDRVEAIKAKGEEWFGGILVEAMIEHYEERDGYEMLMNVIDGSDLYKCHFCGKSPAPDSQQGDDEVWKRTCRSLGCEWDRGHKKKSETQ